MIKFAVYARVLQFQAGPQEHRFYACDFHRIRLGQDDLARGQSNVSCFFATADQPVHPVAASEQIDCDFCKEI